MQVIGRDKAVESICVGMVQHETADKLFDSRTINGERLAKLHSALVAFTSPDERLLRRPPKGFSRCPTREIDEYFEVVAKMGKPMFKWDVIRPAFLWKLELTMSEMLCVEAESLADGSKDTMISDEELRSQREFIMRKAKEFDGTPFTIQRLCELLTTPSRHYKRTDKYLRALEKNINVVTTVTENGERVTGVEEFPVVDDERPQRIEQNFFLKVDECDFPMESKITGDQIKENGSAIVKEVETVADEATPINLSATKRTSPEPAAQLVKKEEMEVDGSEGDSEAKMELGEDAKEEGEIGMGHNDASGNRTHEETKVKENEKEEKMPETATSVTAMEQ
ncbi:Serine/threonine-protein phosphatase 4 regulatory subunit 2-A [Toxocara canis]|uniref:Serine/threonine-protein phosphatase 4 regulatory subunit 2-A n=1 Tax=Toxocara canis TaxID=6265 RepID=A0A0B2UYQ9_TOXCA|nr:Serine/threonine-protein phosphatase 4 regulatory subunit 2-A [Toxocara canis]